MIDTFNRPFLSCLKPLLQREAKCEAIMYYGNDFFHSHVNKAHLHYKAKVFGTREWPVEKYVFSVTDTGGLGEKIQVLPLTVEQKHITRSV